MSTITALKSAATQQPQADRHRARTRSGLRQPRQFRPTMKMISLPTISPLLKTSGLVEAGVPAELGGGGADIDELAEMLRTLALSLRLDRARLFHAHPSGRVSGLAVEASASRDRHVEPLLKRIAQERILLMSSGGSDWIGGSGKAEKVDGGYRITARKMFSSGAPDRRPDDDQRRARNRRRAADGAAFRRADELAAREGARQLAHARHARHRLARRGHRRPRRAGSRGRRAAQGRRMASAVPHHRRRSRSRWSTPSMSAWPRARATSRSNWRRRKQPNQHTISLAGRMDTELTGGAACA